MTSMHLTVDGREAEGVGAELLMVRWSGQRVAVRCGVAPVIGCSGEAVREVHLTPVLFREVRVGREAHRRRQIFARAALAALLTTEGEKSKCGRLVVAQEAWLVVGA
jgi:hypothetical protein